LLEVNVLAANKNADSASFFARSELPEFLESNNVLHAR
jgi:hypothetical protein